MVTGEPITIFSRPRNAGLSIGGESLQLTPGGQRQKQPANIPTNNATIST